MPDVMRSSVLVGIANQDAAPPGLLKQAACFFDQSCDAWTAPPEAVGSKTTNRRLCATGGARPQSWCDARMSERPVQISIVELP